MYLADDDPSSVEVESVNPGVRHTPRAVGRVWKPLPGFSAMRLTDWWGGGKLESPANPPHFPHLPAPVDTPRARGSREAVPSPTFTLVQLYEIGEVPIWHFDAYRLRHPDEAWELGIEDAFRDGISLIEWPERLGPLLPPRRLEITLTDAGLTNARLAALDPGSGWADRLTAPAAER